MGFRTLCVWGVFDSSAWASTVTFLSFCAKIYSHLLIQCVQHYITHWTYSVFWLLIQKIARFRFGLQDKTNFTVTEFNCHAVSTVATSKTVKKFADNGTAWSK